MARNNFEDIAPYIAQIIDGIRAKPLNEQFEAESLLPSDQWAKIDHPSRQRLGWQLRELLRVLSAVEHVGPEGKGVYAVTQEIPARKPTDGGPS